MILKIENGTFSYNRQKRVVLDSVNLEAGPGDVLAILGPNGAGKTTLLRAMMGLLKWQDGRSCIDGKDIRNIPYRELWRVMSYVPQAKNTVAAYTAEEMILLGRSSRMGIFSHPDETDVKMAHQIMERLHISFLREKKCSQISGGELQMVLIARALAAEPNILILDEPESNLDFKNQLLVLDTMSELAAKGMTCIFNTHYPAHALQRANRAFMLKPGGEYIFGDTHSVVTEENIHSAFGVHAVIGNIETPGNILKDVVPLRVAKETSKGECLACGGADDEKVIAVLAIITPSSDMTSRINEILHESSGYIIGRMGMPYPDAGVFIINVTIDGPQSAVRKLTDTLNILPDVSVKATYAKDFNNNTEV